MLTGELLPPVLTQQERVLLQHGHCVLVRLLLFFRLLLVHFSCRQCFIVLPVFPQLAPLVFLRCSTKPGAFATDVAHRHVFSLVNDRHLVIGVRTVIILVDVLADHSSVGRLALVFLSLRHLALLSVGASGPRSGRYTLGRFGIRLDACSCAHQLFPIFRLFLVGSNA